MVLILGLLTCKDVIRTEQSKKKNHKETTMAFNPVQTGRRADHI